MSSSQYIKIFNDTVLKQSILQGYEFQRTDENLGKFTMGELAFTRDTGRVFVGTYTDNKKEGDITPKIGGLLVGNKYYGASDGGETLTYYPTYNSSKNVYNGDYTFDVNSCSLLLFDSNIKKEGNKIDNIEVVNKTFFDEPNNTYITNDIYNDGFIKMRILEPDNDTIKLDSSSNHNVLKADFKFERVADYFGDNWKKENNTIEIKNIILDYDADCTLPSNITIGNENSESNITIDNKKYSIITKQNQLFPKLFPNYILCTNDNPSTNEINLEFKPYEEVVNIVNGDNISVEKVMQSDGNVMAWKINYVPSPGSGSGTETNPTPTTQIDISEIYSDPWEINMGGANIGVLTFNATGDKITANKYEGTEYETPTNANNNNIVQLSLTNANTKFKNGMATIESLYSGGYYNVGLNYLKNANISITSNINYDIKSFGKSPSTESSEDGYLYVPFHAQSVILQVTTTSTTTSTDNAVVRHIDNSGPILFQSKTSEEVTTVEVPLIPYGFWSKDTSPDLDPPDEGRVEESKTFQVYFTNCTVKLLGYRV